VQHRLKFRRLDGLFAVLRFPPEQDVPVWATRGQFSSITRTAEELSVVCAVENVPEETLPTERWICVKLEGPFPFSMTGVLLSFLEPLSGNGVPIFALATFDTDYVLIPKQFAERAMEELGRTGHIFIA